MTIANEMLLGFGAIFDAPLKNPSVLWVILPLLTVWCFLEFFFGKYKDANLGWNSAVGNGLTIFWVGTSLMGFAFSNRSELFVQKVIVLGALIAYGLFLTYISFTKKLSDHVTFTLASPSAVYFPIVFTALWIYGNIKFTVGLLLDAIILYALIVGLFWIIRKKESPVDL